MATRRYVTGGNGGRPGFPNSALGGGGLTDVSITNPQLFDVLIYNGTTWINRPEKWLEPVVTFYDPTASTPVSPTVGDRYISLASVNGWTLHYIYTYNGRSGSANAAVTTTNTTLKDTRLSMNANEFVGMVITCNGKTMTVISNTGNTFTGASWSGGGNPGNGNAWNGVFWQEYVPSQGDVVYVKALDAMYAVYPVLSWRPYPDYNFKPVEAIFDNTSALPAEAANQRYIAMVTAQGWVKDYIYEWDGINEWVPTIPFSGSTVFVKQLNQSYMYDSTGAWVVEPDTWVDPVISIFDNTTALPVAPTIGDRYIAEVTANGWTADYIYEWNFNGWVATVPVTGMMTYNNDTANPYLYTGAAWVEFPPLTAHAIGGALHTASTVTELKTKVSGPDFLLTSQPSEINSLTEKTLPTTSDLLAIEDVADSDAKKKVTIANLVPWLYGTGAPPSPTGLRDGTLYIKYTP